MKKITSLFTAALVLGCIFHLSADNLEDAVKFHVPFDGDCNAAVAEGDEKGDPIRKPEFHPGIYGKAILCGGKGTATRFIRKDNIDFDNPGTVNVWFNINTPCGSTGPAIPFWGIGADDKRGILMVTVMNDPMKQCPCRRQIGFLMISKKRPKYARAFTVGTGKRRICSGWHLISAAWSGNKLYVSLDGTSYRSFELDKPLSNAEFGYARRFSSGVHYTKWHYLIDDLTVYGKKLSDSEILAIYDKGMKQLESSK